MRPASVLVRPTELHTSATGLYQLELRHFGGWLRLRCELGGPRDREGREYSRLDSPRVKLTIYLALKE